MVPSQIHGFGCVSAQCFNGKLDRKLLPEPVFEKAVFRAPVTAGGGDRRVGLCRGCWVGIVWVSMMISLLWVVIR